MRSTYKVILSLVATFIGAILCVLFFQDKNFELLNTAGEIGNKQRDLMLFTVALSMLVVIPVFTLTFHITRKYRVSNPKALYMPEWDGNKKLEIIWWAGPLILITILAIITWNTSHSLDPRRPITSDLEPVKIQVVALEWKWLFIYPDEQIATVNYVMMPVDRPVQFSVSADAPMNSFSIPQLGGQIYAMTGMSNEINLMANKTGTFRGQSANLSGEGFSGMTFNAYSVSQSEFNKWADRNSTATDINYAELAQKSQNNTAAEYSVAKEPMLYNEIVNKYSHHGSGSH